jgi:hypothetical protein
VTVVLRTRHADSSQTSRIRRLVIGLGGETGWGKLAFERAEAGREEIAIESEWPTHCSLPRAVVAPEVSMTKRVIAALQSDRDDAPFRRAVPIALWLLRD